MTKYPQHCEGTLTWLAEDAEEDVAEFSQFIRRSEREIAFEVSFDGYRYCVALNSVDGFVFAGAYQKTDAGFADSGPIQASLYSHKANFLLYGTWIENGKKFHIIARFRATK